MMFKVSRWSTCLNDLTKTPLHLQKRSLDTFLKENGLIAKRVEVAFKAFKESTGYAALNKR